MSQIAQMASVLQLKASEGREGGQAAGPSPRYTPKRILAAVALLYLASGIYLVPPDRQAVVTRFGRVVDARVLPGIHYHFPYPIERIYRLKVRETRRAVVGGEPADETLGRTQPFQTQFLTGDQNVIQMRAVAQFSIHSPADFLFRAENPEVLVRNAVETELARETARRGVDALLTTDKVAVQEIVRERAQAVLDRYSAGISVASVNIETAGPPPEVAEAFRDVAGARADAARKINEARGDAERFTKLASEYSKAQEVTSQRLYLEAMEQVLPRIRKLIVDRNVDLSILRKIE